MGLKLKSWFRLVYLRIICDIFIRVVGTISQMLIRSLHLYFREILALIDVGLKLKSWFICEQFVIFLLGL